MPVVADRGEEDDECFELVLSAPINASLPVSVAVGCISNDDQKIVINDV